MKNSKLVLVLAVNMGIAGAAFASMTAGQLLESLDANKDNAISVEEAAGSKVVLDQWHLLDLNKDDVLSGKEFQLIDLTVIES